MLVSPIPAILVRNASPDIKADAQQIAALEGTGQALYVARGCFQGLNGNYAAGILEGLAYYHPAITAVLGCE